MPLDIYRPIRMSVRSLNSRWSRCWDQGRHLPVLLTRPESRWVLAGLSAYWESNQIPFRCSTNLSRLTLQAAHATKARVSESRDSCVVGPERPLPVVLTQTVVNQFGALRSWICTTIVPQLALLVFATIWVLLPASFQMRLFSFSERPAALRVR